MLHTLKRLIGRWQNRLTPESEANDEQAENAENPKFVVSRRKIVRLLNEVEQAAPFCTVTLDNQSQYTSSILKIDSERGLLTLDELLPRDGNQRLAAGGAAKISANHKGIHLTFHLSQLRSATDHQGIAYFTAPLPDRIYYPQRRTAPRISVASQNISFSAHHDATQQTVTGLVYDLSRSGIGIELSKQRVQLHTGDRLSNCRIHLAGQDLSFNINIRFIKPHLNNTNKIQIGGHLHNLSNRDEHRLSHFIASLERMELRRQKAD